MICTINCSFLNLTDKISPFRMVAKIRVSDATGMGALKGVAYHAPIVGALTELECPADIWIG
jgi:hypothetical protein